MISEKIKKIIKEELKSENNPQNVFGLNLTKCLVQPIQQNYLNFSLSENYLLWTVLVESEDGYRIYYDEETNFLVLE